MIGFTSQTIFALPDLNTITQTFGVALLIAAAAVGACLGTVRGIKKYRAGQIRLLAAEESLVQGRIEKEVNALKAQHELALSLHTGQLEMLERVAQGEKRLAEQATRDNEARKRRLDECTQEVKERDARIVELTGKLEAIVDLNLNLQGTISALRAGVQKNASNIEKLQKEKLSRDER